MITTKKQRNKLVRLYLSGMCARAAAEIVGCSEAVCLKELKTRKIKTRERSDYDLISEKVKKLEKAIIKEYSNGMSIKKIAKKNNLSHGACTSVLIRNGIKIVSISERGIKYKTNHNFFKNIDTKEKAYWLGFIAADGNVEEKSNNVCIMIKKSDTNHLKFFADCICPGKRIYRGKICSKITITSKYVKEDLIKLGIVPRKSLVLKTPNVSKKMEKSFWLGMVDGDGGLCISKGAFSVSLSGTHDIVSNFILFIERELGIKYRNPRRNGKIYSIIYGGNRQVLRILSFLYDDVKCFLKRKMERYHKMVKITEMKDAIRAEKRNK